MQYSKDYIYYSDLYDSFTVSQCRRLEDNILSKDMSKHPVGGEADADRKQAQYTAHQLLLYYEAGERYLQKERTVHEWMQRDRLKDEKLQTAIAPADVHCLKCSTLMFVSTKSLDMREDVDRVLFFYDCPNDCLPRRAFYEDKQEFVSTPYLCVKCHHRVISKDVREDSVITTTYSCAHCGHVEVDIFELGKKEEVKPDEFYEEDRRRFCFSEEKGKKYLEDKQNMIQFYNLAKELEERDKNKDLYEAVAKIKKLPFGEVQKLFVSIFESLGYTNLQFQSPEIGKDVVVSFTVVDSKEGRTERDSNQDLKNAIDKALSNSNWGLIPNSLQYRLGFLSGRVRGLEDEQDLIKFIKNETKSS